MIIKGLSKSKGKGKDHYGPGDTVSFKRDFARVKEVADSANVEALLLKLAMVDNMDDFRLLFDALADSGAEYNNLDDFLAAMQVMRQDWGGQKIFYEKPKGKPARGGATITQADGLRDVRFQEGRTVRLYSAREAVQIQNLKAWAEKNKVATEGFDDITIPSDINKRVVDAPFKGHFGDWAHTVKHARQKRASGAGLICIVLTEAASELLRSAKGEPGSIATAGEGYVVGRFGFKTEATFVSVAIGDSKETWDYLKSKVALITYEKVDPVATELSAKSKPSVDDDDIIEFETWHAASHSYLLQGALIRITNHQYDIRDRVFAVKETYDPSRLQYPDIGPFVTWLR